MGAIDLVALDVTTHIPTFTDLLYTGRVSSHRQSRFNGPLGRSLRLFTRTAHSTHSLCSTPLRYACFTLLALLARSIHGLAHSLRSLPRGTVEIHEYVFTL